MFIIYVFIILTGFFTYNATATIPENEFSHNNPLSAEQVTNIENQALQWHTDCLTSMTPEQLQTIANMAYLLCLSTTLELSVRMHLFALSLRMQKIQKNPNEYDEMGQEFILVKESLTTLEKIIQKRNLVTGTMQAADAYLDNREQDAKIQAVARASHALQQHGQQVLRACANDYQSKIDKDMELSAKELKTITQFLSATAHAYQGKCKNNQLFFNIEPENKELVRIEIANNIAHEIEKHGWQSIIVSQRMAKHITRLIKAAKIVYENYYRAAYKYLIERTTDTHYHTQIFCPKGFLPQEYRKTLLPAPEGS